MKILHLIQKQQLRGAEVFASQLATHCINEGHEALLLCVFEGAATLPFKGNIFQLKANAALRFIDIKAWKKLAQIIKQEKPDIIQANAGDTLKYAVFSKLLFRWKQPIVFRNASVISLYIKSKIIQRFNAFLFSKTAAIISVSNASALDIAKLFPTYKKSILTIPVGIEKNEETTAAIKLAGNPVLVHVGGFSFEKNHAGLIHIFQQFLQTNPAAVLHLVGDGILKDKTTDLVIEKRLEQNVIFHGYQKNPMLFIREANALLLPSIIEGLPGVVLEAFYCKTPVVAYDAGGVGEIIINNKTGVLIQKNNELAFVNALIHLLQNKEQKKRLVTNAYELVTSEYLNKNIAEKFIKAYELIARKLHTILNNEAPANKKKLQNEYV